MTVEAASIRQCWAFNPNAQRCDMPAGHPGDHSLTLGWGDEDCMDFMPVPAAATPPFDGVDHNEVMAQISRAEVAWENREANLDHAALAEMDFGRPAEPPVLVDNKCIACEHQHATGKCRCGCETFIPRLS